MLSHALHILSLSIDKIAGIAAAIAIAALVLRDSLSSIAGVVVAVNMGVMLMIAILIFVNAARSRGQSGKPYHKLYFAVSCVFSAILAVSAGRSTSVKRHQQPSSPLVTIGSKRA